MPPKDFKAGRINGRFFVQTENGYQPLPELYETEAIKIEEEPLWPKENPILVNDSVAAIVKAIPILVEAVLNILPRIYKALEDYPNRRVVYLARYGNPRTRKKNRKRLMRYIKNKL